MRKILIIYSIFFLPLLVHGQSRQMELDSLHRELKTSENDTLRMLNLNNLSSFYVESNRDSSLHYTEQFLRLTEQLNQPLYTVNGLLTKAYILGGKGNFSQVFKLIQSSILISKDPKYEKNLYIKENDRAEMDPQKFRLRTLSNGYHQLGNLYSLVGNNEKAIESFKEVIRIGKDINSEGNFITSNMNIASIFLRQEMLDSALFYTGQAIKYSNRTGLKTYQGYMLNDLATIFFKSAQSDSAKYYYWKSLRVSREQNNLTAEASTKISLAKLYKELNVDSMHYYSDAAYNLAKTLNLQNHIVSSSELISSAYQIRGNADSALHYLSISKILGDSLRTVRENNLTEFLNMGFEEQMQSEKAMQDNIAYKTRIRTIGLFTGLGILAILAFIFYRNNRQKQKANAVLESTLTNLKSTQSQLIQSEKMASLGELTAGIAHEIQNPLNFVNNFSEVSAELVDEIKESRNKSQISRLWTEEDKLEDEILEDIIQNLGKIQHHGKRADSIVKGMLAHSRRSSGEKGLTDINALADEFLRLSYHGLRAKDSTFYAEFTTDFDPDLPKVSVIPQDMGRVLLNIINNAFQAYGPHVLPAPIVLGDDLAELELHKPLVTVSTKNLGDKIQISIKDNGPGIPDAIKDKIFQPFFTTKPTGEGTGLGLSLSYDIIKAHGGEILLESIEGEGTTFTVSLPIN